MAAAGYDVTFAANEIVVSNNRDRARTGIERFRLSERKQTAGSVMKPELRTTPVAALFVALLAAPFASASEPVRGYYVCAVDDGKATPTTYVSDAFAASVRPGPIQDAFRAYVTSNYHERIPLPGVCVWNQTEDQARAALEQKSGGSKVVQTNWKYTEEKS